MCHSSRQEFSSLLLKTHNKAILIEGSCPGPYGERAAKLLHVEYIFECVSAWANERLSGEGVLTYIHKWPSPLACSNRRRAELFHKHVIARRRILISLGRGSHLYSQVFLSPRFLRLAVVCAVDRLASIQFGFRSFGDQRYSTQKSAAMMSPVGSFKKKAGKNAPN